MVSSSKAFNVLSKPSNVTFGPVSYHNLTPQIHTPDNSGQDPMASKPKISRKSSDGTSGAIISNSIVRKSTSSTFGSFERDSRTMFPKKVHQNQKALKPKLPSATSSTSSETSSTVPSSASSSHQSPPKQKNKPSAASTPLRQAREAMPVRSILRGSTSTSVSTSSTRSVTGSTPGPTSGTTSSTKEPSTSKTTEEEMNETAETEPNNCSTTSSDWQFGKKLPRPKNPPTATTTTTNPTDTSTVISSRNHQREEKNVLCIFRENQTLAIGTVIGSRVI